MRIRNLIIPTLLFITQTAIIPLTTSCKSNKDNNIQLVEKQVSSLSN